ncbi:MAG: ABC transporter ATP-binding protein [Dehalococcoidia bacterium]|nr:ABC transporter ATP-binding protein [Dehalococcoidia bacterium]
MTGPEPAGPEPMVQLCGIQKAFAERSLARTLRLRRGGQARQHVLRGVDLSVAQGDFLALLGANGAGKTTILKIVATLLLPDAGSARVLGADVTRHRSIAAENVGYVMADERSFHWRLTAEENLDFFARLDRLSPRERKLRVRELLTRLDLHSAGNRPFGQFSTGMKQRLAVARALLKRPSILLMDEPTRSIDPAHAAAVWQLVREEIAAADGCLVVVTHQVQEALSLCSRVAILADGQVALDTTASTMERYAGNLTGISLSVRALPQGGIEQLRCVPGVRDVRVASQLGGEQLLEVWTADGDLPLAGLIGEITGMGGAVCSLQRATPLQAVVERLLAPTPAEVA